MATNSQNDGCVDFCSPVRNRYFYGKLLDVFHFDLEQNYFNTKRWMLNRLVTGYGVIYGMNVTLGSDNKSIVITPGVAIDRCGHEIIICRPSDPYHLPTPPAPPPPAPTAPPTTSDPQATPTAPAPGTPTVAPAPVAAAPSKTPTSDCDDNSTYYHVRICYVECPSDPVPTLGGDCDTQASCAPGSIREHFKIEVVEGKLCPARTVSRISNLISNGSVDYGVLAKYITNNQPAPCEGCCIPLANIRIPESGSAEVDIAVRPIAYTNDLLFEMILAMNPGQAQSNGGKP
jgi:hypothetical protein